MAELNTGDGGGKKGGKGSKKSNAKVDLTAMVDLAFFNYIFMLTTTLSKPQSMSLGLPDKNRMRSADIKVDENRTMTVMLGDDNKMVFYMGLLATPIAGPKELHSVNGLRKEILEKAICTSVYGNKDKGMIVIIKPSKKSNYKND
jgi:biopolymer transport protein ExbD